MMLLQISKLSFAAVLKIWGGRMKKNKWIEITIISCMILVAVGIIVYVKLPKTAFTVNGYKISEEHFDLYQNDKKAKVTSYFYSKYKADSNEKGFWKKSFNGEIPQDVLENEAKDQLISDTLARIIAKENGIDVAITLKDMEKDLMKENENRADGDGINYGPDQYGIMEYISKTQTELVDDLKEVLLEGELKPTETDLKKIYETQDKSWFDLGYKAKVGLFFYSSMSVQERPDGLDDAWNLLRRKWTSKSKPESIIAEIEGETGVALAYNEISFNTNEIGKDDTQLEWLSKLCKNAKEGELTEEGKEGTTYGVAVVLEREDFGYASFEESVTLLTNLWINQQYDKRIENEINKAVIK